MKTFQLCGSGYDVIGTTEGTRNQITSRSVDAPDGASNCRQCHNRRTSINNAIRLGSFPFDEVGSDGSLEGVAQAVELLLSDGTLLVYLEFFEEVANKQNILGVKHIKFTEMTC